MKHLNWSSRTRAGRTSNSSWGGIGKRLITTVTGVVNLVAMAAPHAQRLDTVGRTKGGASATSSRW